MLKKNIKQLEAMSNIFSHTREDHGGSCSHHAEETGVDWAVNAFGIFVECVVCTEL